jgi:hypothetical protein
MAATIVNEGWMAVSLELTRRSLPTIGTISFWFRSLDRVWDAVAAGTEEVRKRWWI